MSFQIGFPWENKKEMWKTVDLALDLERKGVVTTLYKFTPLPGMDLDLKIPVRSAPSSLKFALVPTPESERLAFKHPLVSDREIKRMIKTHRNARKSSLVIGKITKRHSGKNEEK